MEDDAMPPIPDLHDLDILLDDNDSNDEDDVEVVGDPATRQPSKTTRWSTRPA